MAELPRAHGAAPSVLATYREAVLATYRLQLTEDFGFAAAAGLADYLAELGISHVYLSPILQAAPGSAHGYDVVDHSRISADLGGEDGFRAMAAAFRRRGLGVVVDIVPNHMGIAAPEPVNRQFWSVLAHGLQAPYAHWFDVDWASRGGRLLLPILAGPPEDCAGDLVVDRAGDDRAGDREPVLRYFEHVLPLAPGTAELPLAELLAAQHYELADWRVASTELNWRRFFDVTTLIGIQVQDEDVFAATHEVLLRLVAEGLIDGLRVDHPDGLADPRGYLRRLAAATGGCWVVTEKILVGDEELQSDWACAGTTGYDALGKVGGVFVDTAGTDGLTRAYVDRTGGPAEFEPVEAAAKHEIASGSLAAEIERLARVARRTEDPALADAGADGLPAIFTELVCAVPVYRAYVVPGEDPPDVSVALITAAAERARGRLADDLHNALDAVVAALLRPGGGGMGARSELAARFQQTCGPVMAKGVEDTAFYRWSRLVSLNEVGGEPGRLGVSTAEFHDFARRLARDWPGTMTTLSTHDTKRGEDVRARLAVLAERAEEWADEVAVWHERAGELSGGHMPVADMEYLLWQTVVGAWPVEGERLGQYLVKAMREAKTRTSWTAPDAGYEGAVLKLAEAALADVDLAGRIGGFVARIEDDALVNSLGAKLVQLTMPGVPDLYQGCELGSFSLVDPDNRRPVDFGRRRAMLSELDAGADEQGLDEQRLDELKLLVTARALRVRREHADWYAGGYEALDATGQAAGHVLSFVRGGGAVTVATRLPAGLRRCGGWGDTELALPAGPWRDVLTGGGVDGGRVRLERLLARLPVALLVPG